MKVEFRDQDGVDFYGDAFPFQQSDGRLLLIPEKSCGISAMKDLVLKRDAVADIPSHFRIDGIDRHDDVGDSEAGKGFDMIGRIQAIRRQAEEQSRVSSSNPIQCIQGQIRVAERIAGAGNPDHRYSRMIPQQLLQVGLPCAGSRILFVTPGRLSWTQSNSRLQ